MWLFGLVFIAITALTKCSDADLTVEAAFQGRFYCFFVVSRSCLYLWVDETNYRLNKVYSWFNKMTLEKDASGFGSINMINTEWIYVVFIIFHEKYNLGNF